MFFYRIYHFLQLFFFNLSGKSDFTENPVWFISFWHYMTPTYLWQCYRLTFFFLLTFPKIQLWVCYCATWFTQNILISSDFLYFPFSFPFSLYILYHRCWWGAAPRFLLFPLFPYLRTSHFLVCFKMCKRKLLLHRKLKLSFQEKKTVNTYC